MYDSSLSLTSALDGVGWSASRQTTLPPGKDPVAFAQEAEWAPEPIGTRAENLAATVI